MAQIIDTIIQSETPPKKTNVLWDNGTSIRRFRNGEWQPIGGEYDEILEQINNNIYYLDKNKADKTEIPKKLSQLEQDIEIRYDDTEIRKTLSNKVDKVSGKGLSSNDYTDEEKEKLAGLENYNDTEIRNNITEIESELTELSAEVSGLSEKIENLPSAESDVFKAIFGTTTYEEIKAAYDSGVVVHCDYNTYCYVLVRIEEGYGAYFSAVYSTSVLNLICYASGSLWKAQSKVLEPIANKVTTLSSASTDTEYPSAKAVYDFVGKQGVIRQTQTWTQAADKGYDYVMSDLVRGAIPQANIDLFLQFEKVSFNEQTGYFEIGDLTDISYDEMLKIYKTQIVTVDLTCKWLSKRVRTTISNLGGASVDNGGAHMIIGNAWNTSYVESIDLLENTSPTAAFRVKGAGSAFMRASRLKEIRNILRFDLDNPYTSNDFVECYSLESIRAVLSAKDFSFKDSARLTYESVKYMIGKSKPSTKITLTLHATALANAETAYLADAEQDLATYPTLSDWALSKNIQIATA